MSFYRSPLLMLLKTLLLAAVTCCSSALAGDGVAMNVATYNLRLNTPNDGQNQWPFRKQAVEALIRYHEFDIFGTQEVLPDQIKDLEEMSEYAHVGVGRDDGKSAGEHSAIFFRQQRFTLLDHGDFWLSETPDKPSKGWDARCCNRLATWARLHDISNGKSMLVISVHFDHEGEVARRESAKLVLRWMEQHKGNDAVIVLGDFNSVPDSEQIRIMKSALINTRDVSQTAPYGPLATFNGFKLGGLPEELIDYIFIGPGIRVEKYGVLTDSNGQRYPSDHFPVVTRMRFE